MGICFSFSQQSPSTKYFKLHRLNGVWARVRVACLLHYGQTHSHHCFFLFLFLSFLFFLFFFPNVAIQIPFITLLLLPRSYIFQRHSHKLKNVSLHIKDKCTRRLEGFHEKSSRGIKGERMQMG